VGFLPQFCRPLSDIWAAELSYVRCRFSLCCRGIARSSGVDNNTIQDELLTMSAVMTLVQIRASCPYCADPYGTAASWAAELMRGVRPNPAFDHVVLLLSLVDSAFRRLAHQAASSLPSAAVALAEAAALLSSRCRQLELFPSVSVTLSRPCHVNVAANRRPCVPTSRSRKVSFCRRGCH
jgi:hypothetical protein